MPNGVFGLVKIDINFFCFIGLAFGYICYGADLIGMSLFFVLCLILYKLLVGCRSPGRKLSRGLRKSDARI